jgi:hypothetical protein
MFGSVPKPLHPYLVSFRHALVDLPRIHDDALSADIRLGAHLKALKYARRKDLAERIRVILLPELEDMDIDRILRYIDRGPIFGFRIERDRVTTATWRKRRRWADFSRSGHE